MTSARFSMSGLIMIGHLTLQTPFRYLAVGLDEPSQRMAVENLPERDMSWVVVDQESVRDNEDP